MRGDFFFFKCPPKHGLASYQPVACSHPVPSPVSQREGTMVVQAVVISQGGQILPFA